MSVKPDWKRVIMTVCGISLCSVGVALFKVANFGTDPFQVLCAGLHVSMNRLFPISFGTLYLIFCAILLAAMFLVDRHYIGLGTVLNLFLLGYMTEFVMGLIRSAVPNQSFPFRVVLLAVGIPLLCLSSALYFTADMGVSTYDVWALVLDRRTKFPFRILRVATDLLCVAVGFVLGGTVGVGTIITAFFMGPLIEFFNQTVARPLLYGKDAATKN